jgi:hypothetical protein
VADFFARTEMLAKRVGNGTLKGEFAANREYAAVQHERGWLNYMGTGQPKEIRQYHQGGGPKFVESVWKEKWPSWMQNIASDVLDRGAVPAVREAMEDFDLGLAHRAPLEDGELIRSGTYTVTDDGTVVAHKESEADYKK